MLEHISLDSVILENVGGLHSHSLAHILNVDNTDDAEELNIIKHSPYFDQDNFIKNIKGEKWKFYCAKPKLTVY